MTKVLFSAVLFLLLLGLVNANPNVIRKKRATASCGQTFVQPRLSRTMSNGTGHRIVGGVEAKPHSLPWTVSVQADWGGHWCGGTLIRVNDNKEESDIVISAAHCYHGGSNRVAVGAHSVSNYDGSEQIVKVARIDLHENYKKQNNNAYDIAILKLEKPVKFNNNVQPACLPAQGEPVPDNTMGIVSGWGYTTEGGQTSDVLMQVQVPSISSQKCIGQYGSGVVAEHMLCAAYDQGGKDSCQGDSGGPLVFKGTRGFTLQGVVSFGAGCARPGLAGVYARVSNYIDWINNKIRELSSISGGGSIPSPTTKTPAPTPRPTPGSSGCADQWGYCKDYAKDCPHAEWMKESCRKTCGHC